jgi:hypothetical protein
MKHILTVIAISTLLLAGCAKEGLDGNATLVIKPQHHGDAIISTAAYADSVYIKFGVTEVPADPTHDYDAVFAGEVGEDHLHVENVKWGYYSLFCTGWDTTQNERVAGGIILEIKRKQREQEIEVIVPVSED